MVQRLKGKVKIEMVLQLPGLFHFGRCLKLEARRTPNFHQNR